MKNDLAKELDTAMHLKDRAERGVTIAAIIAEALREVGQDPVLVGGAAVEFYTDGGYATRDIDLVASGGEKLWKTMAGLGFEKIGKDFVDRRRKLYLEFPSATLKAGETTITIQVGKRLLRIISLEDLIVDRLSAFKFWQSAIDGVNALLLLELGKADETKLQMRAQQDQVKDALRAIHTVREEAIRKKLSQEEANRLLEHKMKELIKGH